MSAAHRLLLVLGPLVTACKAPPEAPAALEELAGYLFAHAADDDPEALIVGVDNLDAWLRKNEAEAAEGYTISRLPKAAVGALDQRERSVDGLVGAAVSQVLAPAPKRVTRALVIDDPTEVYPDTYSRYDRSYDGEPRCFVQGDCESLSLKADTESSYPLGLTVGADFVAQYRWIEAEAGLTMVQRTWLRRPAEVSVDWMSVPAQYFLSVNIPDGSGTRRLQATWIEARLGDTPVPEDMALKMVNDSMIQSDAELEAWLSGG
jgi:hypothetical protein